MQRYPNLPHNQWPTQQIADAVNADEQHWRTLAPLRKLRRRLLTISSNRHRELDVLEFSATRPVDDCIAQTR